MAALTDLQFVALNAPQFATAPIMKNGVTFADWNTYFQTMLDTAFGNPQGALALIFLMLTTEDRNSSLQLGEFAYTRRTGMTYDDAREFWESRYRASMYADKGIAPKIAGGCGFGFGWGW